ncbi:Fic family protein [Immundisolibacter cernigliae]|uniref:Filamentation induced by cAMP protein Fic-like C-terminal domain-containing protein n=1 Tax=Immundisolibacter cernigliae TaxID=1810504 RepID=A0A1B1YTX5_9GAMM|nr:hypothetical protein [Immundisolibacter cernigliae]ANX04294.1 hypothetical protein PG2T_08980 [Immundisolibacter cernigliae]
MSPVGQREILTQLRVVQFFQDAFGYAYSPLTAFAHQGEHMGTGTRDMIRRCVNAGLQEPEFAEADGFVTTIRRALPQPRSRRKAQEAQVTLLAWEVDMLRVCAGHPATGQDLLAAAGYSSRTGNFKRGLAKLLSERLLEMTIPDQPRSHSQQYRLSAAGEKKLKTIAQEQKRR